MNVTLFPMDKFAESPEGKAILQAAYASNSSNITQRVAPINSSQDADGLYLLLLLDWASGMIVRIMFDKKEIDALQAGLKAIASLGVLDAIDTEGMTVH